MRSLLARWWRVNRPLSPRVKAILILLGLLVLLVDATLLTKIVNRLLSSPSVSRVQIVSPSFAVLTLEGETVVVEVVATGRSMVRSELLVDGSPVDTVTVTQGDGVGTWAISHSWEADGQGQHQFTVKVYDPSGNALVSSSLAVGVVPPGRLAFASDRDENYEIYTMRTDSGELDRLTRRLEADREPACGGSDSLAFASTAIGGGSDIWLMRGDSHELKNLTATLGGDRSPRWSPDGGTIAFASDRFGLSQLFLMQADGSDQFQLTSEDVPVAQPSWAPDSSSLLFSAEREGNWGIFSISLDEGIVRQVTDDPADDWYPAWSPRGDQIAFVSDRHGSQQIYIMEADGTGPTRLTDFPSGAEQPQWSPDGEWLVFVAYTGGGERLKAREIYLMRPDGSDRMRLTDNEFDDTEPSWCE